MCLNRFGTVGYGCMTCIGNSGPLADSVVEAIDKVLHMRGHQTIDVTDSTSNTYIYKL